AYVVSFQMMRFQQLSGNTVNHFDTLSISKDTLGGFLHVLPGGTHASSQPVPATMHDAQPGDSMWLVEATDSGDFVGPIQLSTALSASPTYSFIDVTVPSYSTPPLATQPNVDPINTGLSDRIENAAMRGNRLVATQTVTDGNGHARARWYEFTTSPTDPVLR